MTTASKQTIFERKLKEIKADHYQSNVSNSVLSFDAAERAVRIMADINKIAASGVPYLELPFAEINRLKKDLKKETSDAKYFATKEVRELFITELHF